MSKIIFGNSINLLTAGTPSSGGYIVAYDLDGIIKQKDEFGVITPIGGGPTAGSGTASLSQTLLVGNTTNGTDIITSNDDVIIAATGGGVLNLRFGSNGSVVLGVPAETYGGKGGSGNGGGVLYLDPSAITLGLNGGDYSKPYVYLTTQYSQFADYSTHSSVYYGFNLYRNSSFNNYSNGISIKENVTFSFTSANQNNFSIIIGSRNSTTSAGVYNSPVIGGQGLSATQSNTVYLGNTVNINNAYTLPTSDGANGEVLSTDGSGTSYWTSVPNFSNSNLTFTGNRSHNTNGNTLDITTDGGGYAESWYYMDSSELSMGWLYNQIVFSNGISSSPMIELRTGPSSATFSRMKMNPLETVFNENGYVYDFRVEGDTDTSLFFVDASTDRVGVGTTGPGAKLHVTSTPSIDLTKWISTYGELPNSPLLVSSNSTKTNLLITNDDTTGVSQLIMGPNSPGTSNALFIKVYGASAAGSLSENSSLTLGNSIGFTFQTSKIYLNSSIGGSKEIYNVNEVGSGYLSQRIGGFGILQDVNSNIHNTPEAAFTAKLRNYPPSGYPSRLLWLENLTTYTVNSGSQDIASIINNATVGIGLTLSGTMLLVDDQINSNMNLFRVKKQGQDKLIIDPNGRIGVNSSTLSSSRMYVLANNGEYAGFFEGTDESAIYATSNTGRGIYALSISSYGVQAISTNSYGLVAQSANNYAIWSQSTSVSTKLSILSNGQCDFNSYDDSVKILRLEDNGNVGVGTASPTSKLMVWDGDVSIARTQNDAGAAIPARLLLLGDYSNSNFTEDETDEVINTISFRSDGFSTTASAFGYDISQTNISGSSGKLFITNLTGGVSRLLMSFQDNGNIGIGTSSPTTEFHIWATQSGAFRLQDTTQGNGYILVSDSNGVGTWTSSSNIFNGPTGSGTTNYVPRWLTSTQLSSTSSIYDDGNNVGIGTSNPLYKLHVDNGDSRLYYDSSTSPSVSKLSLVGSADDLVIIGASDGTSPSIDIGIRGISASSFPGYGANNTGFIYVGQDTDGLNIINQSGTTENYIRFYAGGDVTSITYPDIHIHGDGINRGYVGLGTASPSYKLDVDGDINTSSLYRVGGVSGWSGTFSADGQIVTVNGGIITSVV